MVDTFMYQLIIYSIVNNKLLNHQYDPSHINCFQLNLELYPRKCIRAYTYINNVLGENNLQEKKKTPALISQIQKRKRKIIFSRPSI